ncbi:MAG: tryptophan synthase subunit beta, partial [Rariglobus sp.]
MSAANPPIDRLSQPDASGHFGQFGGVYVPETLMTALQELGAAYEKAKADPLYVAELRRHLKEFAGRPTELYFAERLTAHCGGAKIYFKRE